MKIVAAAYLHGFGGAEKQLIMLCNQMVERNHDVTMVLIAGDDIAYPLDKRVKIISLLFAESRSRFVSILKRTIHLRKVLLELSADVIINFNMQSACMLSLINKSKIGKVIYCERGDPGDDEYSGLLGLIRKITFPRIDGFVFQTFGARDYFNDSNILAKSTVIPNPCFLQNQIRFTGEKIKKIVTIGRLHPQKNQSLLIKAFASIREQIPNYILQIYGDGELKESLISLAKELNVDQYVHFMGNSKSVLQEIKDASLFVLSSDFEGIPNVLIEAMAIGLPCISTDCKPGGARLLIQNGRNGLITAIGDEKALGQAMIRILRDEDYANTLGKNAMEISNTLSPKNIYDKWENFFFNIIQNR